MGARSASRLRLGTRRAIVALTASILVLTSVASLQAQVSSGSKADTVFIDGKVLLYGNVRWAQAVAVKDGIIAFVGGNGGAQRWIGSDTDVIDLNGKTLMPGLVDGHAHGSGFTQCSMGFTGGTVEQVLGKLKDCLLRDDQVGLLQTNSRLTATAFYSRSMVPAGTLLTRHVLDRLSADPTEDEFGTGTTRPILVRDSDGHTFSTNTQAIVNAGLDENTPDPVDGFIGRDTGGYPNGLFADFSASWGPSPPAPPDSTYLARVNNVAEATRKGITSYMRPNGSIGDLATWQRVADEGHLTVRINQAIGAGALRGEDDQTAIDAFVAGLNDARDQFDGYTSPNSPGTILVDTVKFFCDGVAESPGATAAMLQPYNENVGTPEDPVWVPSDNRGEDPSCEDATKGFTTLDRNRWSMHIHAIGNRATRVSLDNFQKARAANGRWDSRHTITHLEFVHPADAKRFGKLGVVANLTMNWAGRDAYTVDSVEGYLNPDVMKTIYATKNLQNGGAVLAGGSDWPVTALVPWRQIEMAITRTYSPADPAAEYEGALTPEQGISRLESLKMHSLGAAHQLHIDDITGSIQVGKFADLIVLDQNVFTVPVDDIELTNVLLTMFEGQIVFQDPAVEL